MHDNQRSGGRNRSGSRQRRNNNRGSRDNYSGSDRRGGNNYSPRSNGSSQSQSPQSQARQAQSAKPVKQSFWQKLISIFTGKPKQQTASAPRTTHPANREPSQSSHRRFESPGSPTSPAPQRQARKPELIEVSSPKIYVGNLSFDATETDLEELFNGVGKVQNAEVVSNKYTHKSKGFAFVTMLSVDEARRAVTELHDKEFMGRKLVVSGAKTSEREYPSRQQEEQPREEQPREEQPRAEEQSHEENALSEPAQP